MPEKNAPKKFEIDRVAHRAKFPGGPNENPGIRLQEGFLPGHSFGGGSIEYLHANGRDEDGEIIPSLDDAVDPQTGRVVAPGEIFVVNTDMTPPAVVKKVGSFVTQNQGVVFESSLTVVIAEDTRYRHK